MKLDIIIIPIQRVRKVRHIRCKGVEMWLPGAYSSLLATYVLFITN